MNTNIRRGKLELLRQSFDDEVALRDRALEMTGDLAGRPDGRFDDLACGKTRHPGHRAVDMARACLAKAIKDGDLAAVAGTKARIRAYFDGCVEAALRDCPDVIVSESEVTIAVFKEWGEASTALVAARETRNPSALHRAKLELLQAVDAARALLHLPAPRHSQPVRAAR